MPTTLEAKTKITGSLKKRIKFCCDHDEQLEDEHAVLKGKTSWYDTHCKVLVPSDANTYLQENNESIRNDWRRACVTELRLQKRILRDVWNRTNMEVKKKVAAPESEHSW